MKSVTLWAYWYKHRSMQNRSGNWHMMIVTSKKLAGNLRSLADKYAVCGPVFQLFQGKVRGHP